MCLLNCFIWIVLHWKIFMLDFKGLAWMRVYVCVLVFLVCYYSFNLILSSQAFSRLHLLMIAHSVLCCPPSLNCMLNWLRFEINTICQYSYRCLPFKLCGFGIGVLIANKQFRLAYSNSMVEVFSWIENGHHSGYRIAFEFTKQFTINGTSIISHSAINVNYSVWGALDCMG